jgi:hypothetical protein
MGSKILFEFKISKYENIESNLQNVTNKKWVWWSDLVVIQQNPRKLIQILHSHNIK